MAALTVSLAGCSQSSGGTAKPGDYSTPGTAASQSSSPTGGNSSTPSTSSSGGSISALKPCDLITPAEASAAGLGIGAGDNSADPHGCMWTASGQYSAGVTLRDSQGLKDIVADQGKLSTVPVGKHDGRRLEGNAGAGSCMVSIGVSSSSRADVLVITEDTAQACQTADKFAKLVEPKLP
ncbi:DUF3558 family protein [Solihabitans fulvus]|uniref:DUF3558 family protein n=1 Tax=Solihabitans fulvus TaxID=1892852 RepID=UPI0016620EA1|nr:DUF3558 family protein [Solihabitans fulvus]